MEPSVSTVSEDVGITTRAERSTQKYDYASLGSSSTTQFSQIVKNKVKKIARIEKNQIFPKKLEGKKKEVS